MTGHVDPRAEYERRLAVHRGRLARASAADARLAGLRLATFFVAILVALAAFWAQRVAAAWLMAPGAAFVALAIAHDRVIRRRDRAGRAVAWYEWGMARLEDRWAGVGETGEAFQDEAHVYARDLDLFGQGSLFQLVSTARTRVGEETLARWLLTAADAETVRKRQAAVRDLVPRHDLREDLGVAGVDVRAALQPERLVEWAGAPAALPGRWARAGAAALAAATLGAAAGAWSGWIGAWPLVAALATVAVVGSLARRRVTAVLHAASEPARELLVLAAVLHRLESERFAAPRLVECRAVLEAHGRGSVQAVRRLARLLELHDWQHNEIFRPLSAALLWGTQVALAIEAWRRLHGPAVGAWLDAIGEVEALASLATYAFERPSDAFPEVSDEAAAFYDAESLAHPLIPRQRAVPNGVRLSSVGTDPALAIVSGSNMSGKTTLLRSVGVSIVLALAGAPVCATRLRLSVMAVGATLRVQDSLQAGRSRFFAEVTRVRQLVDVACGPRPLVFLLDELFHGTNSHDRVAGADGVLRRFLEVGAVGLVTTHDLALAAIADRLGPRAVNVHFEDQFIGNEMLFDFRLRSGPVARSNALALMRAVGLDVPLTDSRHAP